MSPTLSFLLGLTALIPQAFSLTIPADLAVGLTNNISVDTTVNPLPPPQPRPYSYDIPGTSLTIIAIPPFGPLIRSPADPASCLASAQTEISNHIAASGDGLIPRRSWSFADHHVAIVASSPFPSVGTYSQLAAGLKGVLHFITVAGDPGARQFDWVLADDVQGIVMKGAIGPEARAGGVQATATATVGATSSGTVGTASATASIVAVKELVTS